MYTACCLHFSLLNTSPIMMHSILLFVTLLTSGHDACQYASEHCPNIPRDDTWLCGAWHNPDPQMDTACSQCCEENCCFGGTFDERYCGERSDDREIFCQCTEKVKSNAWINHFFHPNGIGTITFTIIYVVWCTHRELFFKPSCDSEPLFISFSGFSFLNCY